MHNLWLLSFFSTNKTGAPQDEELGWIKPFCNCSPSFFLSSFNSSTDILYGLFAIGPDPGSKSIRNSTSLSGGILGNSSGNTSGYSLTIGTLSMLTPLREFSLLPFDSKLDLNLIRFFSRVVSATVRLAQSNTPSYLAIQSIPKITSSPWESRIIKLTGNLCFPNSITRSRHPRLTIISPPGELTLIGHPMFSVGNPFLSANALDMNECDAPVSKRTSAGIELSLNLPATTSDSSYISSTFMWFTCPFWKGLGLLGHSTFF